MGHDQIFLSDLHNYNIVGYTIAVALIFADTQFFHWKPYSSIQCSGKTENKRSFQASGTW